MKYTTTGFAIATVLMGTAVGVAPKVNAHETFSSEHHCARHLYNRSNSYWYVTFYKSCPSSVPGPCRGDFNVARKFPPSGGVSSDGYIQINPGTTHHLNVADLFMNHRDMKNLRYKSVRVQSYTGPNKSGQASYNSKFSVEWKSHGMGLQNNKSPCIYLRHNGSTGDATLNEPADGDIIFSD